MLYEQLFNIFIVLLIFLTNDHSHKGTQIVKLKMGFAPTLLITLAMKGIEKLDFLTEDQKTLLENSALQYRRFARIYIEVIDNLDGQVTLKIQQKENPTGNYLNRDELLDRLTSAFEGMIPEGIKVTLRAIPFKGELDLVDLEYVEQKKVELGLKDADLSRMLNIRKDNLSVILNSHRGLTKWQKAAFYYLFKTFEKQ